MTMKSPLASFLRQLGYVVLERMGAGKYSLLGEAPEWVGRIIPEVGTDGKAVSIGEASPFLENFLQDAEEFWKKEQSGFCESGPWVEQTKSGKEIALEAKAMLVEGKRLLAIHSPDPQYAAQVRILQTARNSLLEHEKLLNEIQKKEILLHCIVHDLSQPLSAMRGSFDCLARENDAVQMAKLIDLGRNASEQQESMIRQILGAFAADLKVTKDAEKYGTAPPDLLAVARKAASTLSPAFEAKGVRVSLNDKLSAKEDWFVQGEETRLFRIFTNLLENALRYTPAGSGVTIGFEEDRGFCKAFVDDEGPGLPVELRPAQLFSLFAKGREDGGKAGLGLYFCRITVERWGGSIGCTSLAKVGSRFWFRLPRVVMAKETSLRGKLESSMVEEKQKKPEKPKELKILLADDQEDIRMLTTNQLQRNGHEVVAVDNGKAALDLAQARHFDVVLLDEEMPCMSGVQVAKAIREYQKERETRSLLIALTGNNTKEDRERLLASGFDSVLGKPFRLESLEATLRNPAMGGMVDGLPERQPTKEDAKLEDLLNRVGGDDKLLRQMIRTFLRETPKRMEALRKTLQRKDGGELSSRAHALKGSVSIFGALLAIQHTQSLQDLGRFGDFDECNRVFTQLEEEIAKLQQNLRGYAKESSAGSSSEAEREKPKQAQPSKR